MPIAPEGDLATLVVAIVSLSLFGYWPSAAMSLAGAREATTTSRPRGTAREDLRFVDDKDAGAPTALAIIDFRDLMSDYDPETCLLPWSAMNLGVPRR